MVCQIFFIVFLQTHWAGCKCDRFREGKDKSANYQLSRRIIEGAVYLGSIQFFSSKVTVYKARFIVKYINSHFICIETIHDSDQYDDFI